MRRILLLLATCCAPILAADREADVERLGSAPYASLDIPEPMVFDLVCELGAPKGALEINALAEIPLDGDDPTPWAIAPEVEYAALDSLAFEFELPIEEGELDALKFAAQWTFGQRGRFIHGTQFIAEYLLHEYAWELSLLYVPAYRFNDTWSVLPMFGIRSLSGRHVEDEVSWLVNTTIFADLTEHWVAGFEVDAEITPSGDFAVLLMPQLHVEFGAHWVLQFGAGVLYLDGGREEDPPALMHEGRGWFPHVACRLIYNF
ncbi:MAG: hypothetical protein ACYS0E_07500 [Planctomycetota bacterium]|jgi:hypothetical protein